MPQIVNVEVTHRWFNGPESELAIRLYRAHGSTPGQPAILYLHGGGWALGDLDTHDGSCRLLAQASGCTVISLDYRRSPEHPFPAAVDDTIAAWLWLHDHADELSIDASRTGVMGDSAGGNLAAVLAVECRSNDLPAPIAQCLVYPVVDGLEGYASIETMGDGFGLDLDQMQWLSDMYVTDEALADSPRLCPLRSEDLSGVAPALVVTAGFDPLRDQGFAYARALEAAGVPVVERCYDDLIHGFFGAGLIAECGTAASEVCQQMGRMMSRESAPLPRRSVASV